MKKIGWWWYALLVFATVGFGGISLAYPPNTTASIQRVIEVGKDDGGTPLSERPWGPWQMVASDLTNIYGDGGTLSQGITPKDCEDYIERTGDVCVQRQTGTYPVTPVSGSCALTMLDTATLKILQASAGWLSWPSPATTPSNDAGSFSDATIYTIEAVAGTPKVTIWRRCRQ